MGIEIERKFLTVSDEWRTRAEGVEFRQGYLCTDPAHTVRVRLVGKTGTLTIKGFATGASRAEFEYEIPFDDAEKMIADLCDRPIIEKKRYSFVENGHLWEVDEFQGENQGLVIAEVELESESTAIDPPSWLGKEVTDDHRYSNAGLVRAPYSSW